MIAPAPQQQTQTLALAPIPQVDQDRKRAMSDAWKAYHGDFPKPYKVDRDQPDDNVIVNFCNPIVAKGASFLFGQVLKLEAPDQDFLNKLWGDDDDRMTIFSEMAINGGVCGQVFVKLIQPQRRMKYPRIVVMNPAIVRKITPPDDCSLTDRKSTRLNSSH